MAAVEGPAGGCAVCTGTGAHFPSLSPSTHSRAFDPFCGFREFLCIVTVCALWKSFVETSVNCVAVTCCCVVLFRGFLCPFFVCLCIPCFHSSFCIFTHVSHRYYVSLSVPLCLCDCDCFSVCLSVCPAVQLFATMSSDGVGAPAPAAATPAPAVGPDGVKLSKNAAKKAAKAAAAAAKKAAKAAARVSPSPFASCFPPPPHLCPTTPLCARVVQGESSAGAGAGAGSGKKKPAVSDDDLDSSAYFKMRSQAVADMESSGRTAYPHKFHNTTSLPAFRAVRAYLCGCFSVSVCLCVSGSLCSCCGVFFSFSGVPRRRRGWHHHDGRDGGVLRPHSIPAVRVKQAAVLHRACRRRDGAGHDELRLV